MRSTEARKDEEARERARHDQLYDTDAGSPPEVLNPSAWQRFDGEGRGGSQYFESVRWLGDLEGKRVLDLGCGTGWFSVILAKRGADRVDGVDISPFAVEQARRMAEANGVADRCFFHVGSAYDMPYDDDAFDVVAGQAILHHLRDKDATAEELHRVMKPGAVAVFAEPLGNSRTFEQLRQWMPFASEADDPDHWRDKMTLGQLSAFQRMFEVEWREFELIQGFSRYLGRVHHALERFDELVLSVIPGAAYFARALTIKLTKR